MPKDSSDKDDSAWDALICNPHDEAVTEGQAQGRSAGRQAGYEQGWNLGQTTALEYGMELGFVRGVLQALQEQQQQEEEEEEGQCPIFNNSKAHKTMQELSRALDSFPAAHAIFQSTQQQQGHDDNDFHDDSERPQKQQQEENVRQLLQRIRARFRLLMVQLKMSHLSSLQQVMQHENDKQGGPAIDTTGEW